MRDRRNRELRITNEFKKASGSLPPAYNLPGQATTCRDDGFRQVGHVLVKDLFGNMVSDYVIMKRYDFYLRF